MSTGLLLTAAGMFVLAVMILVSDFLRRKGNGPHDLEQMLSTADNSTDEQTEQLGNDISDDE